LKVLETGKTQQLLHQHPLFFHPQRFLLALYMPMGVTNAYIKLCYNIVIHER
jgi:hypothetical protein